MSTRVDLRPGSSDGTATAPNGDVASMGDGGRVFLYSGGRRTEIADFDPRGGWLQPLLWSPDSQWLALVYTNGDRAEIWLLARDGSTRGTIATRTAWSPAIAWWIDGLAPTP